MPARVRVEPRLQEPWTDASAEMQESLTAIMTWVTRMESQRRSEWVRAGLARRKAQGVPVRRQPGAKDTRPRRRSGYLARWERERLAGRETTGRRPVPAISAAAKPILPWVDRNPLTGVAFMPTKRQVARDAESGHLPVGVRGPAACQDAKPGGCCSAMRLAEWFVDSRASRRQLRGQPDALSVPSGKSPVWIKNL